MRLNMHKSGIIILVQGNAVCRFFFLIKNKLMRQRISWNQVLLSYSKGNKRAKVKKNRKDNMVDRILWDE
jgi:mannose/fructose/N-acetylgalactosamine-specific phosphotransferase system component IID